MLGLLALAAVPSMTAAQPVTLVARPAAGQVLLEVIGDSAVPFAGRYVLEATSGSGNRSRQSGTVAIQAGRRMVLVSLGLGTGQGNWSARLTVSGPSGSYEQTAGGR